MENNQTFDACSQEKLEETYRLDYGYVLNESERFTERCRLSELAVESFVRRISTNLMKKIPAEQAGGVYGAKYAEHATDNTLEPISLVTKDPSMQNANINHFTKDRPDINTKLIETMYKDTCGQLKNNQQYVRDFFESFVAVVKKVGIPFASSAILNIA